MTPQTQEIIAQPEDGRRVQKFSRDQVDLLKRTICKGATDDELKLFVSQAERLGLDPFARQIFAVKRWDSREGREVMAIQTSIDGFRLVAERTGKYQGQEGPFWCGDDGDWSDVWLSKEPPAAAKVGVWREGFKIALFAVARYGAYVQTKKDGSPNGMWAKMPDLMLAKCAESLALRKAFPQETSGIYTQEEMAQAESERPTPKETADRRIAEEQAKLTAQRAADIEYSPLDIKQTIEQFQTLKGRLGPFANLYYECLKRHGVEHANGFRPGDRKKATACYKDLVRVVLDYEQMRDKDLAGVAPDDLGVSDGDIATPGDAK